MDKEDDKIINIIIDLINEENKNLIVIEKYTNQIIEILKNYSLIIQAKEYTKLLKILKTKLEERRYIDTINTIDKFDKFIKEIENLPWKCTRCGSLNKGLSLDSMCFYCGKRIDPSLLQKFKSKKSKSKKSN